MPSHPIALTQLQNPAKGGGGLCTLKRPNCFGLGRAQRAAARCARDVPRFDLWIMQTCVLVGTCVHVFVDAHELPLWHLRRVRSVVALPGRNAAGYAGHWSMLGDCHAALGARSAGRQMRRPALRAACWGFANPCAARQGRLLRRPGTAPAWTFLCDLGTACFAML